MSGGVEVRQGGQARRGRREVARLDFPVKRELCRVEVGGRREAVGRREQGRVEVSAEVGPNCRLGDTMAPSSYR